MKKRYLGVTIGVLIFMTACSGNEVPSSQSEPDVSSATQNGQPATVAEEQNYVLPMSDVPAPSLAENMYDEQLEQSILVMLPPSYYATDAKYPVVYYLHGHGGSANEARVFYDNAFPRMESEEVKEFIIVGVDGGNKLGGSFYANSPATGNWEDYVTQDVLAFVDGNFRTVASNDARGISGFSMGGSGAVNIALKHPDLFSYIFAVSPGLFDENGLTDALETWYGKFLASYGAAFAPNVDNESEFYDIPTLDGSDSDNAVVDKWESGFGNLAEKVQAYKNLGEGSRLKAIHIEYGSTDSYTWIPKGSRYFSELLNDNDIANTLVEFDGGHTHSLPDTVNNYVSFFSDNF